VPNNTELAEPGWTPRTLPARPAQPIISALQLQQHAASSPRHRQYPHPLPVRHVDEPPAWYGSLRSATEPKRSDRKVRPSAVLSISIIVLPAIRTQR